MLGGHHEGDLVPAPRQTIGMGENGAHAAGDPDVGGQERDLHERSSLTPSS